MNIEDIETHEETHEETQVHEEITEEEFMWQLEHTN